jgi:hypothetical protein
MTPLQNGFGGLGRLGSIVPGWQGDRCLDMARAKRRTPVVVVVVVVVVRAPRTAPLSEENRQQAVMALTVMIDQWWSGNRGRRAGADGGSDRQGGATA